MLVQDSYSIRKSSFRHAESYREGRLMKLAGASVHEGQNAIKKPWQFRAFLDFLRQGAVRLA